MIYTILAIPFLICCSIVQLWLSCAIADFFCTFHDWRECQYCGWRRRFEAILHVDVLRPWSWM